MKYLLITAVMLILFYSCKEHGKKPGYDKPLSPGNIIQTHSANANLFNYTHSDATVCGPSSLSRSDSLSFLNGGGRQFRETLLNNNLKKRKAPAGMRMIPGGEFSMGGINPVGMFGGGKETMNDARPIHRVNVSAFYMDETEVTNSQFTAFVKATGYITVAERKPTVKEFPDASVQDLVPGSLVFTPPVQKIALTNAYLWWRFEKNADWRHPEGQASNLSAKNNFPVVQVCWEDAAAYAKWSGKRLPTEAEWEFAARGGKAGNLYPWGNELKPNDQWMANIFEGSFPDKDNGIDGYVGLAPVMRYKPNGYGLYDMAGNVWEWCSDWYRDDYYQTLAHKKTVNPTGPQAPLDRAEPEAKKKVQRGGSFLCTDQYCNRYMVGTRGKGEYRSASNHIGFRCVKDINPDPKKL